MRHVWDWLPDDEVMKTVARSVIDFRSNTATLSSLECRNQRSTYRTRWRASFFVVETLNTLRQLEVASLATGSMSCHVQNSSSGTLNKESRSTRRPSSTPAELRTLVNSGQHWSTAVNPPTPSLPSPTPVRYKN